MSAIITSLFRLENANNFIGDITNVSNSVYVFIGKTDPWSSGLSTPTDSSVSLYPPADDLQDRNSAWQNMIALQLIGASNVENVCPRYTWTSGTAYVAWNDADTAIFTKAFYVVTDEYKVFKCIVAGSGASTVKPTATSSSAPFTLGDGYTWKYMYTIFTTDAANFLTSDFMPVKTATLAQYTANPSSDLGTKWLYQLDCQTNRSGKVYRYVVTNGGTGYTSTPTAVISGDGTGAVATVNYLGGTVTSVVVSTGGSGFETNAGSGYNQCFVTITGGGGTGATVVAVLSPTNGHGWDPVSELGGFYVGISTQLQYAAGGGDFPVGVAFRQLGLIKNPYEYGTTTVATETDRSALKSFTYSGAGGFAVTDYITGTTSGAIAFIDAINTGTSTIRYHQNFKTGFVPFTAGETITGHTSGTGVILSSGGFTSPDVQRFSGTILFLDNRDPIMRSSTQIENINMIIQF